MGTVFRARRKSDGHEVAIKVLRPSLSRNARLVERLRREAEISMRLDHPGLVKGFGFGEEGGYHYVVMESCAGRTLAALLKAWGSFPEERVLDLGIQVAEALACAHENGVVHRDVKPSNILIDDDGKAKLTDLGLAKAETDPALTRDGGTVGTPQYMSPEQAQSPGAVDERSDLYSLGATLYHMAVGSPPFEGDSAASILARLVSERAPAAASINPAISEGLDLVLRRLLTRRPADRYATARDLLADLRAVQRGRAPSIDARALQRAEGGAAKPVELRRLTLVLATGLGLALLIVGGLWATGLFGFGPWSSRGDDGDRGPMGFDKLVAAVRDPERDFRTRFELLRSFEGREPGRSFELASLQQQLLRDFDAAITRFHQGYARERLEAWVNSNGMGANLEAEFERQLELDFQRAFAGYKSATLPPELRDVHSARVEQELRIVRQLYDAKVDDLLARCRQSLETQVIPALDLLLLRRDFGTATKRIDDLLARPATLAKLESDEAALRDMNDARFDALLRSLSSRRVDIVEGAKRLVGARRHDVEVVIDDARRSRRAGFAERALQILLAQRRRLEMAPPWLSLPPDVDLDTEQLRQRLEREVSATKDELLRLDFETLALAEDAVHARMSRDLDVGAAKALLAGYRIVTPEGQEVRDALALDLDRIATLLTEVPRLLFDGSTAGYEVVDLRDGRVEALAEHVSPGPPPAFTLRLRGDTTRKVAMRDFDPAWIARRVASRPDFEQRRIGLGMLLFMLDDFDAAFALLRSHRLQRLIVVRERREAMLARGARDEEGRAEALWRRIRDLEQRPGELAVAAISPLLDELELRFRASALVAGARTEIDALRRRLERERERRGLVAMFAEPLRSDAQLTLGDADRAMRMDLLCDDRTRFVEGLAPWRKVDSGLAPPARNGSTPHEEAASALEVELPMLASAEAAVVELSFVIPEGARTLEVLAVEVFGSRVLLTSVFDDGMRLLVNAPRELKRAMPLACAAEARPWAFVAGLRFTLRLELDAVEGFAREARLVVPDVCKEALRLEVKGSASQRLRIATVGDVVLRSMRVGGSIR